MANITAKEVAALRARTGLGMMACKNALVETDGDAEKAIKLLREKGLATAAKKEGRIAAEGVVDCMTKDGTTVLIEVNTETDFVAKNAKFREFVKGLLNTLAKYKPADLAEFSEKPFDGTDLTVAQTLTEEIAKIGEKIAIRRFAVVEGVVSTYIHGMGTTGVVVKFDVDDKVKDHPDFPEVSKNIALQIAAGSPPTYISRSDVPRKVIDDEKEIIRKQIENDPKMAEKPEKVIAGIITGKLGNYYKANCLLEQGYIKEDKMSVGQYLDGAAKKMGGKLKVSDFRIFEKGEGIQKREDDFVDEIAKLTGR